MQIIQLHSRVGPDGVLKLDVPMGPTQANTDVVITVQSSQARVESNDLPWHEFIEKMYGSCANSGLERPDQGSFIP